MVKLRGRSWILLDKQKPSRIEFTFVCYAMLSMLCYMDVVKKIQSNIVP